MRMLAAIVAGFLAMVSTAPAGADVPEGAGKGRAGSVPETLNAYYPPAAGQPIYLAKMRELETSFSGIIVDLMEDDIAGARSSFDGFAGKYREVAGIVPEWKGKYPGEPVKELGAARARFQALADSCLGCHEKKSGDYVDREVQDTVEEIGKAFTSRI